MSSRYIPRIKGVKSMEQFERGQSLKGKSLTESNSVGVNFPGRIYLILQRRTYEKFKYEFDFTLHLLQIFPLFNICERPLPDKTCHHMFENVA